jgi:Protein of unknown function (DUF1761)
MIHTNFLAVLVAGIAAMVVGYLWYGPFFGKTWSQAIGLTREKMEASKKNMTTNYVIMFIGSLVMAYVLSNAFAARPFLNMGGALWLSFWIWLGFMATVLLGSVLWENKPMKLYWINSLYYLVTLWVMAIILLMFR